MGSDGGGQPVIRQRGFAAMRQGLDVLREQLRAEALRRGGGARPLGRGSFGDGAVWLWRLAEDRRPQAHQRLNLLARGGAPGGGGPGAIWGGLHRVERVVGAVETAVEE